MNFKSPKSALFGSVCAAVLLSANTAAAQDFTTTIDFDLDFGSFINLDSLNQSWAEGALGAANVLLEQTALSQLNTAAARVAAGEGLDIDLSANTGSATGGIALKSINEATARTTQLDATVGGTQIAIGSFNTATVDITANDSDVGLVTIEQTLNGNGADGYPVDDAFDFTMGAANYVDAGTAYAGTAQVDGGVVNPTFGTLIDNPAYIANDDDRPEGYDDATAEKIIDTDALLSSVQQAAVSLNTLRITAAADTTLELDGQGFDVAGFSGRGYYAGDEVLYDQNFAISAFNQAVAFSPRPATLDFVNPGLVDGLNDPSVANLDQVAAVTMNTMSFGETDGSADFAVLANTENVFSGKGYEKGYESASQYAGFNGFDSEVNLGNEIYAFTNPDSYFAVGGQASVEAYEFDGDSGIGNVGLTDLSQVAALTVNSISQQGEGALTLKAGYMDGDVDFERASFAQQVSGLDADFGGSYGDGDVDRGLNVAIADTYEGDVAIDTLSQIAQLGFNAISSNGDINGWTTGNEAIRQNDGSSNSIAFGNVNLVEGYTYAGGIAASSVDQMAQVSFNALRASGDLTANLEQVTGLHVNADEDFNTLDLDGEQGNVTVADLSQIAAVRLNSVSVDGAIVDSYVTQSEYNLDDLYFDEGFNELLVDTDRGNVSVDGVVQVAQLSANTLSAGSIGALSELSQTVENLGDDGYLSGDQINDIQVASDARGNATLKNASQTFVLNLNTASASGLVEGDVYQTAADIDLDLDGSAANVAYVYADQDLGSLRNLGGNASVDGLTQTLASNINTFAAESLDGAMVYQYASAIDTPLANYAYVDAEWGVASAERIVQTALNRVNYMSIVTND